MLSPDNIGELRLNYISNYTEKLNLINKKMLLKMKFAFDVTIFPLYEFVTAI